MKLTEIKRLVVGPWCIISLNLANWLINYNQLTFFLFTSVSHKNCKCILVTGMSITNGLFIYLANFFSLVLFFTRPLKLNRQNMKIIEKTKERKGMGGGSHFQTNNVGKASSTRASFFLRFFVFSLFRLFICLTQL